MNKLSFHIPSEIFTAFNNVNYFDEPHKYYVNNKQFISVTTLIHKYQEEFNEDYWADYKANQFQISSDDVKRAWRFINKKGTMKGSAIHDYAENLFQNKIFEYPEKLIKAEFGFDPILPEYDITKEHVNKFYNDVYGKLIPIKTEYVVYDEESMIAGMLDILFYNVKTKEIQIWDWKTNKKFDKNGNERFMMNELHMLPDCDFETYSLQLGMYKYIIEKNTGLKLGKSYIVWFSHNNSTYEVIEAKDRSYYINMLIEKRIKEIA